MIRNLQSFVRQVLLESLGREYWGISGAGMIFVCPEDGTVFLQKRSRETTGGASQWAFPGGGIHPPDKDEDHWWTPIPKKYVLPDDSPVFYDQALEEVAEECGSVPQHKVIDTYLYEDNGFKYRTFIASVKTKTKIHWHPEAEEESAWETDGEGWANMDQFSKLDLFFGFTPQLIAKTKKAMQSSRSG